MKQLMIVTNGNYGGGKATSDDLSNYPAGAVGIYDLDTKELVSEKLTGNACAVLGRGADKMPFVFSEIDAKSMQVTKAEPQTAKAQVTKVTIPTTEKGKIYTIIVAKTGVVFNERNKFTATVVAKDAAPANVAKQIAEQVNAMTHMSGVSASASGAVVTFTGELGAVYTITCADELIGVAPQVTTKAQPAIGDVAYVQDLASRCAAGKGFNLLADEGKEIYPGYPEPVAPGQYYIYSVRFAVPRVAAKQRDEVVWQLLHFAVNVTLTDVISALDTVLGLAEEAADEASAASEE